MIAEYAANDRSGKLRYPVGSKLTLAVLAIMPDFLWRGINEQGMTRPAR